MHPVSLLLVGTINGNVHTLPNDIAHVAIDKPAIPVLRPWS